MGKKSRKSKLKRAIEQFELENNSDMEIIEAANERMKQRETMIIRLKHIDEGGE